MNLGPHYLSHSASLVLRWVLSRWGERPPLKVGKTLGRARAWLNLCPSPPPREEGGLALATARGGPAGGQEAGPDSALPFYGLTE